MNPDLEKLHAYPFARLRELIEGVTPPDNLAPVSLFIGEPKHATPGFITEELITHMHGLSRYPLTRGEDVLREAIAGWLTNRFNLPGDAIDPETNILPVNGTREALFAFAQCVVDRNKNPLVLMPNPFYQIYEGAVLLAGAEPGYMNTTAATGYCPDFDSIPAETWGRCQLVYICSPGNPTGAVMDESALQKLIRIADQYDFLIASDECYSEIYHDEDQPPPGLLQAAVDMGNTDFSRCMVFHSLSKRSNVPGLRSGFVAGDAKVIRDFLHYRTYHGCAMPPASQFASIRAWQDEHHVIENRKLYREKFQAVAKILDPVLNCRIPAAGFYLWPETPNDDSVFARELYEQQNVSVLPGSFLSREVHGINPGQGHIRMALVAPLEDCVDATRRIRSYTESL